MGCPTWSLESWNGWPIEGIALDEGMWRDAGTGQQGRPTDWDRFVAFNIAHPRVHQLFTEAMFRGYRALLRHATFTGAVSILELGGGTGSTSRCLAEFLPTDKITLVDSNPSMLETARRALRGLPCTKAFIEGDLFELALDERFDLVHSAGLVEHFSAEDRQRVIQVHADLTGRGGYCVIYAPTPTLSYRFWRGLAERLDRWLFTDEIPLEEGVLVREVERTGLRVLGANHVWRAGLTQAGVIAAK